MSLKNLKKLALAAAVAVSATGLFAESAQAFFAIHSGNSDNGVDAIFTIDSEKNDNLSQAIQNISFAEPGSSTIFFQSSTGSIVNRQLLETSSEVDTFLSDSGLASFGVGGSDIFSEIGGQEPVVAYVLNLRNDLPTNDEATLTLFYDDEVPEPDLDLTNLANLTSSLDGIIAFEGLGTVPGVLVRNRRGFDASNGLNDDLVIDRFGVDGSNPFDVKIVQNIPEPTTTAGLFLLGAFGGLSMLKRNQRVNKSKAMVEN
ncbi:MAG: PEP-CTERM sorting domain-containing protein [Nostocaceae cyanobacterium]|nr:PEP-CTERM sorting domain-containing protein [Nostocaceae cyanobacterium]